MGRKDNLGSLNPIIQKIKEKEKLKNSVLEVFRARQISPNSRSKKLEEKLTLKSDLLGLETTKSHTTVYSSSDWNSSSSMSDHEEQSSELRHKYKKTRRKRSESRHARKSQKSVDNSAGKKVCTISECRITLMIPHWNELEKLIPMRGHKLRFGRRRKFKKLGLFKHGKKSHTISRASETITIPEQVRKETEKDLKKILNVNNKEDLDDNMEVDSDSSVSDKEDDNIMTTDTKNQKSSRFFSNLEKTVSSVASSKTPHLADNVLSIGRKSKKSTPCNSVKSFYDSATGSTDMADLLPPSPPVFDIAETLVDSLNPKALFLGRNLNREIKEELNKLLKQNSSVTPVKATGSCMSLEAARSVKRTLFENNSSTTADRVQKQKNYSKSTTQDNVEIKLPCIASEGAHCVDSNSLHKQNHCFLCSGGDTGTFEIYEVDAKHLLEKNDLQRQCLEERLSQSELCNSASGCKLGCDKSTFSQHSSNANERHSSQELYGSQCSYHSTQSSGYQSHGQIIENLMETDRTHHPVNYVHGQSVTLSVPDKAVVTQYRDYPEYMPDFHGDYITENSKANSSFWPCSQEMVHIDMQIPRKNHDPSGDILDYIDHSKQPEHVHGYSNAQSESRALVEAATPDSDGSPVWIASSKMKLPPKPTAATPSPPDSLYPRRLF